jgi:regulator of RNase E activity RraA
MTTVPQAGVLADLLREFSPSCLVADAHPEVETLGGWQLVRREHRIAGPALTIDVPAEQVVDVVPVLALSRPGDVVVIACHGATDLAMWGGLMTSLATMAGVVGTVVDGSIRDVDELRALDWPAWYRRTSPPRCPPAPPGVDPLAWMNVPVRIGAVTIQPGDYVVADENGVSIVPPKLAGTVAERAAELLATEAAIRDRIAGGVRLEQLLAEFGGV